MNASKKWMSGVLARWPFRRRYEVDLPEGTGARVEQTLFERLETALNESDVLGVRLAADGSTVDVLLHVLGLPEYGPISPDSRRVLQLTNPSTLRFLLRTNTLESPTDQSPAIPLRDMGAVEDFFASLSWGGSMYGWTFFDDEALTGDWPNEPSLTVEVREEAAGHTFYWFNECAQGERDDTRSYCIEGTIAFDDVRVLDADGGEVPLETFIADGERFWTALHERDERLSSEAQRQAQQGAPKWRDWASGGETVTGAL